MSAELIQSFVPMLLRGLRVTMQIAVTGILLGFVLGSLSGYALQSRNRVARGIANVYVWIIRGTPIVVQALYVCFVVPALITLARGSRYTMDSNLAGTIVITLNAGAFISPIVKGALESINIGQKEAGMSCCVIAALPPIARQQGAPRITAPHVPIGSNAGEPNNIPMQTAIVKESLKWVRDCPSYNQIKVLPYEYRHNV